MTTCSVTSGRHRAPGAVRSRIVPSPKPPTEASPMRTEPEWPRFTASRLIAILGTAVVIAYAALAALQILVLNPLAGVPGASLEEIYRDLAAAGEPVLLAPVLLIIAGGPLLAMAMLAMTLAQRRLPWLTTTFAYLALLALGSPAYFIASLGPGAALADTYGISGADSAIWGIPLHGASGAALFGFLVLVAIWAIDIVRQSSTMR